MGMHKYLIRDESYAICDILVCNDFYFMDKYSQVSYRKQKHSVNKNENIITRDKYVRMY